MDGIKPENQVYIKVKNFNRLHPDKVVETPLEAKQKYIATGYVPTYVKNTFISAEPQPLTFSEMLTQYRENPDEDELVEALMMLPVTDRNLFIIYMEQGSLVKTAQHLKVSVQTLRREIRRIKEQIKINHEQLLSYM